MLKFIWKVLIWTWIIEGIQKFRKNINSKNEEYNKLSQKIEKIKGEIEEISKDEQQLKAAWMFIHVMWKDAYHEYIEKNKISIAKIIKSHHEKNTLTWENRDVIIQDIVEDMEKVKGSQIPEMKYMDTILIHFLLYHKKDVLSDLIGIDKKKITLEWKE